MPCGIDLDADRLEADPLHPRPPAGGHQQPVAPQFPAAVEGQHVLLSVSPGGGGVHPQRQLNPVPAQRLAELLAQWRRLAGKHAVGALDQHRLAAQAPHDLRDLDARRPAAQHEQPARDGLHARRLAGAPDPLQVAQPGDRRHDRSRAGRHHDVLRGVPGAVDVHHAGARQPARAAQQVDAPVREPALLAGVGIVRHHEIPPGQRGRSIDPRGGRRLVRLVRRLARAQQRLRRDASPVRALAADQFSLHEGDTQPARGQRCSAVLARRPAAENDHVVVTARAHRYLRRLRAAGRVRRRCA